MIELFIGRVSLVRVDPCISMYRPLYFEVTVFEYFVFNVFYIYLVVWVGPNSPVYAFGEGINALPN